MRKVAAITVAAIVIAVGALVIGPTLWAQVRGREVTPGVERFLLRGPGSEVGVTLRELRPDEISTTRPNGVFVQDVRAGGPAERAGIRANDVILEFDGERIRSTRQFIRLVRESVPGRVARTTIVRDGNRQTFDVTPEAGGGELSLALPDVSREIERGLRRIPRDFDFDFQLSTRGRLGVSLTPLTDQLASYFGAEEGVLVSSVEPDSPAAQAGLLAGDVITSINGRAVSDPADVIGGLRDATPGAAVEVRVVRDKKGMTLKATVPERDRPSADPRVRA
jgi:serine protease Do